MRYEAVAPRGIQITVTVRLPEIWVGNVTRVVLPDVSIDDTVFGVKAIDRSGNQSIVATYLEPVIKAMTAAPATPVGPSGK